MAQRYCTNCGNGLGPDDAFCACCGKPAHETAAVAVPKAKVDVPVPPGPTQTTPKSGRVGAATSKRNAWIALGVAVWVTVLIAALASGSGFGIGVVVIVGVLMYVGVSGPEASFPSRISDKDERGRLILNAGWDAPVTQAERTRLLDEEISEYMRAGFFDRHRMETNAQLVKPKLVF